MARRAVRKAPAPAGYSGTPLVRKLGLKPGARAIFVNAPRGYSGLLGPLPEGFTVANTLTGQFDFIQVFATSRQDLAARLPALKRALRDTGMLWISWPKLASKTPTDVTERAVHELGLATGLVDVKVCAVDPTWSAFKFVWRLKDRGKARA